MSKFGEVETKVATAVGFHGGRRLRAGDTFRAPSSMKGRWFTSAATDPAGAKEALSETFNVLGLSAAEVKELAPTLTNDQIAKAISAETGSQKRKNVLAILRDESANRVGQIDGPDPASKSSDEKEPLKTTDGLMD